QVVLVPRPLGTMTRNFPICSCFDVEAVFCEELFYACSFEFARETRSSEDSVIVFRSMNPIGDCSSPRRTEPSQILSCCFGSPLVGFQVYGKNESILLLR